MNATKKKISQMNAEAELSHAHDSQRPAGEQSMGVAIYEQLQSVIRELKSRSRPLAH